MVLGDIKSKPPNLRKTPNKFQKPLDFAQSIGIMCVTNRKGAKMIDLKPYYQVKLTLLRCKVHFSKNPPKTEDEKYACDIIRKAYWINEKKKEMLDYKKKTNLLENYYKTFAKGEQI